MLSNSKPFEAPLWDLRASERFCQSMARQEAKNFYWGFISLPADQRIAIYALYDFARQVDDVADGAARCDRDAQLAAQRERVRRCMQGSFADPVMHVLAGAVERYEIPEDELQALIDGVAMDLHRTRYESWEELTQYCRLVASVVGRMCVRVFGFRDPVALEHADDLGLALQLINILRDVREDAAMGRIYLPQEDLRRFGVGEEGLLSGSASEGWRELVAFEARRARELYAKGIRVTADIPHRPAICVQTMAGIYQRILDRIERDPDLPLSGRASLSRLEKLGVVVASWIWRG
ncbi:MAG: presqualene diphosphate synthase HpnD [bacterium]|nr:presqualene diphosphate synthase HpnD [bacterium]